MCTVTYISKGANEFILTSNRDENPSRSPSHISRTLENGLELLFPRDNTAGGTWIAVSNTNKVICILNGAYEFHQHTPPYRRSRGLMALDFFKYQDAESFFKHYEFGGMEPFTMVNFDDGDLWDVRWDGKRLDTTLLDSSGKYIWASATLYTQEAKNKRKKWFLDWQESRTDYSKQAILHFHKTAGEGDAWNDIIMNRLNMVRTVSITQINKLKNIIEMDYNDLLRAQYKWAQLKINNKKRGKLKKGKVDMDYRV